MTSISCYYTSLTSKYNTVAMYTTLAAYLGLVPRLVAYLIVFALYTTLVPYPASYTGSYPG